MNFNNYHMKHYNVTRNHIDTYAEQLFFQYDRDRSGTLEIHEIHPLLNAFMRQTGGSPIDYQDVMYLCYTFDYDGNGTIDYREYKMMLKQLGGLKTYNHQTLKNKKNKNKSKKQKKNKGHKIKAFGMDFKW